MKTIKARVLFVCLGNICRSPSAHGIFRDLVRQKSLTQYIEIDSAGTGDWHIGHAPDKRAIEHAKQRGFDISDLRARQVSTADFFEYDYIIAMDGQNLSDLQAMCPPDYQGYLGLFLPLAGDADMPEEVPDPYYGGAEGFELVLDMVEKASIALLDTIEQQ